MGHPLLARLASPDAQTRRAACREAAEDASAILLVDALVTALGDPDRAVARLASDALTHIARRGGGRDDVDRALRRALHAGDAALRFGAAFTSARLEPPAPRLLPALVEALGLPDGDRRWAAAKLLVETGRLHGEVLLVVLGLLREATSPVVRRMATYCLRELAPDRPEALRALLAASRDADAALRRASYTALAVLLDSPPEAAARLHEAAESDADPAARRIAFRALEQLRQAPAGRARRAEGGRSPSTG
jgi:hypothetical protein